MTPANWFRYGLAAAAAASAGGALILRRRPDGNHDAAPARTARYAGNFGDYSVAGATVTIRATPEQIIDAWRSLPALWAAMEFVPFAEGSQPGLLLAPDPLRQLASRPLLIKTVMERDSELIVWRSEGTDHADMHGRMRLRDNAGKGTAVEVIMAVKPGDFRDGLQTDSALNTAFEMGILRDLRRMRMLIETGEIATAKMRPALADTTA